VTNKQDTRAKSENKKINIGVHYCKRGTKMKRCRLFVPAKSTTS
jgi:hypothetical protein